MTQPEPWWVNDPVLVEIRRRTAEEFGIDLEGREPESEDGELDLDEESWEPAVPEGPDPVMWEFLNSTCRRELGEARDGLANARKQYDAAVLKARAAGFSWGEIGNVVGVSRQQLHRRFST